MQRACVNPALTFARTRARKPTLPISAQSRARARCSRWICGEKRRRPRLERQLALCAPPRRTSGGVSRKAALTPHDVHVSLCASRSRRLLGLPRRPFLSPRRRRLCGGLPRGLPRPCPLRALACIGTHEMHRKLHVGALREARGPQAKKRCDNVLHAPRGDPDPKHTHARSDARLFGLLRSPRAGLGVPALPCLGVARVIVKQ